jgi:hypothetical protein
MILFIVASIVIQIDGAQFDQLGLSLAGDFQFLVCRFAPCVAKKRHTVRIKYHAAAGESAVSDSPN